MSIDLSELPDVASEIDNIIDEAQRSANSPSDIATMQQNQQAIQQQMDIINQARQNMMTCGTECQQNKNANELHQKFLNAKENVETAPEQYNIAEKNYLSVINGEQWWNNFKKERLKRQTTLDVNKLNLTFSKKMDNMNKDIKYYESQYDYLNSLSVILNNIQGENKGFQDSASEQEKKVQTSLRKTTYYDRDIKGIDSAVKNIRLFYYFIVIGYSIASLFFFGEFKDKKAWALTVFLVIFPFIIVPVVIPVQKTLSNVIVYIFTNLGLLNKRVIAN